MLPNSRMDLLFGAAVQATEEAIVNALIASETMTGNQRISRRGAPHTTACARCFASTAADYYAIVAACLEGKSEHDFFQHSQPGVIAMTCAKYAGATVAGIAFLLMLCVRAQAAPLRSF